MGMENSTATNRCVLFLTRSTTIEALRGKFTTSSQSYEVNLISSLAQLIDTTVINIGGSSTSRAERSPTVVELRDGLRINYIRFGPLSFAKTIRAAAFLRQLAGRRESVVLTTGYHLNEMIALVLAKTANMKTYSIVYDTHKQGNSRMPLLKRMAANAYFQWGFSLLDHLSGMIVLNDLFVRNGKPRCRILKSRIGGFGGVRYPFQRQTTANLRILFAGTLNSENGVELLLQFLTRTPNAKVDLVLAGYGELEDVVVAAARHDSRLRFLGTLTDEDLDAEIAKSDLLVCLRDPESAVTQYAFPSKLIKFMSSGIPVVANKFPGLTEEYTAHLAIIEDFSAVAFGNLIDALDLATCRELGRSARAYIESSHRWLDISREMLGFMFPSSNWALSLPIGQRRYT